MPKVLDTSTSNRTTMKFKNSGNSSVIVEVISDDVEIRIGETKWAGVAYVRDGRSKLYIRTKAEFKSKFVPVKDAES
jgi:hypothetical protein